jgi:hypothetical protein
MSAQAAGIRRPSTFLSLAPVSSESYPKSAPEVDASVPISPPLSPVQHRSSSVSSVGEKQRFLKLGPVFWGGVPGQDDFAVEE